MKSERLYILLVILLIVNTNGIGQKQNYQWRFGQQGGISFNTNPPSWVLGSAIATPEGSASVADRFNGNLLFYTNGITVWDAKNQVMPNGTGLLGGTSALLSSTTAAVIIPKPGSSNLYYIVTIDEQFSGNGVRYSIVDMNLNGGMGDVLPTQKNVFLFQTDSEKLEVVPAKNSQDIWLITHDNPGNSFYAFLLTSTGFQSNPVVSTIGGVHGNGAGHMKINRQFNKMACGNLFDGTMELYDFNNATGVLSGLISWILPSSIFSSRLVYGIEFSPDGKVLYITNLEKIVQYDISNLSSVAISSSAFLLPTSGFSQPASLQLGPDEKIYINAGSIDVINCPNNLKSDCGFVKNAFKNQSGGGGYGLPKWVFYPGDSMMSLNNSIVFIDSCSGNSIHFSIDDSTRLNSIKWTFDDPISGNNNFSNLFAPSHTFDLPGVYNISVITYSDCITDTIYKSITVKSCNNPYFIDIITSPDTCAQSNISFGISSNHIIQSVVSWFFDDPMSGINNTSTILSPTHVFSNPGIYNIVCIVDVSCSPIPDPNSPITTPCFFRDTLYKSIKISPCDTTNSFCSIFIPTAFTPNQDGVNDFFKASTNCTFKKYELTIFSRWGEKVFTTYNSFDKWNGQYKNVNCPSGIYPYILRYQIGSQKVQFLRGFINILR